MSAITKDTKFFSSIHSYRTKVKLVIHSHVKDAPIVLAQEIVSFSTQKSTKGVGTAVFNFIPNKNYLNSIFPNDYVNLYIDRADGEGWTRTFFGFVDRLQENYSVEANGTPRTSYTVTCSDFTKVFDKTHIYFNPHIDSSRKDFDGSWIGAVNVGGVALLTKGVSMTGSPPDVLMNNIFVMLGASSQFVTPVGYAPKTKNKFREERKNFVIGRLKSDVLNAVPNGASVEEYIKNIDKAIQAKAPFSAASLIPEDSSPEAKQKAVEVATEIAKAYKGTDSAELFQLKAVMQSTSPSIRTCFLDILDVFTFCERGAIDGYTSDVTIWQKEGSLLSLLTQQSNELVNEMFFDLRPAIDSDEKILAGGDNWSREQDEIGHNWSTTEGPADANDTPNGIRYVPALVYREYPFSTVDSLDATALKLSLNGSNGVPFSVGKIQFGAIFSDKPNQKGRHVIEVENINIEDNKVQPFSAGKTQKHIDVAVIKPTEIMSSNLGRSDAEHYNLTQYYSDAILGESARFYMHDVVPITNAVGITRHGLRVRDLTSNFARFADHAIPFISPDSQSSIEETVDGATPTSASSSGVVFPIDPALYTATSFYGWRERPQESPPQWRWHHGIDLFAPKGTPVKAVADGLVVAVAPAGTKGFKGYGNVIVIKHNDKYNGRTIYSVYAHLDSFDSFLSDCNPNKTLDPKASMSKDLRRDGGMSTKSVTAGTVIGTVGSTTGADSAGRPISGKVGFHLHFEIAYAYPSKQSKAGVPAYVELPAPEPQPPTPEVRAAMKSVDPQVWFLDNGINLIKEIVLNPDEDDKDEEETDTALDVEKDVEDNKGDSSINQNTIDGARIRSQIARWALLDDHWYQHNIEYLSGTIVMRGAPEIRVGYRLDIDDPVRPLSFYVEGVEHSWEYPGAMTTTLTVTRGQPNNPFPVYVLPYFKGFRTNDVQRKEDSRLGKFFTFPSTKSARNGTFFTKNGVAENTHELVQNPDEVLSQTQNTSGEMYIIAGGSLDLDDVEGKTIDNTTDVTKTNESKVTT